MNWKNLEDYPLKDLQKMWLDYFDKLYCSNSKAFFVSRIGYRLQELKFGGLKPETKNMLIKMFNSKEYRKNGEYQDDMAYAIYKSHGTVWAPANFADYLQ